MKYLAIFLALGVIVFGLYRLNAQNKPSKQVQKPIFEIQKSEAEWKKELTPLQYKILREKGTEPSFTGKLLNEKRKGTFLCAGCENPLFKSDTKFESGTGWPSFWKPISQKNVLEVADNSYGMVRTEVVCGRCGGHLGHVFDDGPKPTGLRYCLNSAALIFTAEK